ncbi:TetM/TetW/TetO/TetS family tetracycline resistance ribosomal protection protein [Kribbella albertanoniae]|uniref:TetM/TetW/TetO/TetS family tetracycline resistance ribosomal protection protein n=1 Tax=Kribbella albertanoniae TaxID=1266829 RepID=A0A4R4QAQ3_9ACTN|nr:TetM/TetW/TetO/TetS family tetracycline resistance ribosomal protection protein [Kribbella albertanoniae]TDC32209.1 TetM/TetW/TetO/TetS family tetracycline resistance ribosomal protection protein [Kribbella albertanoniae]
MDRTPLATAVPRRWLNLGVLAHVDAGKTSLTEALLQLGGAVAERGRVDDGTTQTDSLAMERRRGITIRAAVATFHAADVGVNIVDTPGHPDFIAEVDRSLSVLDGAVLVVSAVEGIQAQTIVLHRALRRLDVPTIFFVNKVDRMGADVDRTIGKIRHHLTESVVPLGSRDQLCADLAGYDDLLLQEWVDGGLPSAERLWRSLRELTSGCVVSPVLSGSARTLAGVEELTDAILRLFPTSNGDAEGPTAGQVFKIERTSKRARLCSIRLRAGSLAVRDHVAQGTVTALQVHQPGGAVPAARATAGQIIQVEGLDQARIGDWIGTRPAGVPTPNFRPPALQSTITATDPARQNDLYRALAELADIDPLITLRVQDDELHVSLYGKVQQEVIAETLATEYGIEVVLGQPSVICIERPTGIGHAVLRYGEPDHHYPVTLGLTVAPAPPGSGVALEITAEHGSLPLHVYGPTEVFREAVLKYLEDPLSSGPHGWPVTDVKVTLTESGYPPASPRPAEVRATTALVVTQALQAAGTTVCEPIDRIRVEFPSDTISEVLKVLGRHGATTVSSEPAVVEALLRTGSVDALRHELIGAAHGLAVVDAHLDHYAVRRSASASSSSPKG